MIILEGTNATETDRDNMNNNAALNGQKRRYGINDFFYDLNGVFTILLVIVNTCSWLPLILTAIIFKLIPTTPTRKFANAVLNFLVTVWISINTLVINLTKNIKWNVTGLENLNPDKNYLVLSNHQSWSDIVVLQKLLNRKVPMLRFFIKQQLIWVPVLGLAWWALDYPFMKRYSKAEIAKKPELAGKDIEATQKACEKYKTVPVSVMNFVEGTRFTEDKRVKKESPYKNLLKPRAGGTGLVLSCMGKYVSDILNVTIKYGDDRKGFWDFLSGRVKEITVVVETIPVTEELLGDYHNDPEYRERFINWLNNLWSKKDQLFESL